MMKGLFLGIDTSNYRTSFCVINEQGEILFERKELIPVKLGERGMMQSEALFHHLKKMPQLLAELPDTCREWKAIAASTRPRPVKDSYMPVFTVGESLAKFASALLHVPFYETSHQEGHIAAGIYSLDRPFIADHFLAIHLSGGTSELLKVRRGEKGYEIDRLGGTKDLHAGQLIDRLGVAMGCRFPAGPELEKIAEKGEGTLRIPSSVDHYDFSFSGPETACMRALQSGVSHAEVAWAAQQVIANTVEKILRKAIENTGLITVLIVGGVASNRFIQQRLKKRLEHPAVGADLFFTSPEYSGDNAFGVASIARERYKSEHYLDL